MADPVSEKNDPALVRQSGFLPLPGKIGEILFA
jgi:hypothetical protein